MRCILLALLCTGILISCCSGPVDRMDHRVDQIIGPVVQVFLGDRWAGSGTIVASDDGGSTILTAHHVIADHLLLGTPLFAQFVNADGELERSPCEALTWSTERDVAVIGSPVQAKHVALVWKGDVDLFSKCYAAGISPTGLPLCNQGEVLGSKDGFYYVDAHVCFGYSGGALYVEVNGNWQLVGVLVGIGTVGPYPLFHLTVVVDVRVALEAMETPILR